MSSSDPTQPADDAAAHADAVLAPPPPDESVPEEAERLETFQDAAWETVEGPSLFARLGVELLGSFALVLAGVGVAFFASFTGAGPLGVALAFGLAYVVLLAAFGGHLNPAVTLGAAFAGRTRWVEIVPFWLAQLAGACLAVTTLVVALRTVPTVTPDIADQIVTGATNGFGDLSPFVAISGGGFSLLGALLVEVIVTGIFVGVVLALGRSALLAPAAGLAYAVGLLVALPVTNGGLNPARSTATAIFAGGEAVAQLWVFWAAPLLGAAIAGLLHALLTPHEDDVLRVDLETDLDTDLAPGPEAVAPHG